MKLNLLIFGGSSALVVVCFVIGTRTNPNAPVHSHGGWAIFYDGSRTRTSNRTCCDVTMKY